MRRRRTTLTLLALVAVAVAWGCGAPESGEPGAAAELTIDADEAARLRALGYGE